MFNYVSKIVNVNNGYYANNQTLIYATKLSLNKYSLESYQSLIEVKTNDNPQHTLFNEVELITLSNTSFKLFDSDFNVKEENKVNGGIGDFNIYNGKEIIITTDYDYKLFLPKQAILDIYTKKLLFEGKFGETLKVINDVVYGLSMNKLSMYEIKSSKKYWSYGFEKMETLPRIITSNKNLTIVAFDDNEKLITLDKKSGKVIWEKNTLPKFYSADKNKEKLHTITTTYKSIGFNDGIEFDNFLDRDYFKEMGIYSQRSNFIIMDNHIITTDWKKGRISAFNTITHKFDWIHEENGVSFPASKKIYYCEPHLFVHDSNDSLHIFKKKTHS